MSGPEAYPWDPPPAEPLAADSRASILAELGQLATTRSGGQWRMGDLLHLYREGLPRVPIARDPTTGLVLDYAVDTFGLDGPFWDYHHAVRRNVDLPPSVFSLTGAMCLDGPVPTFSHLAKVGPGAPFVVPRLFVHDQVVAVVSQVDVGGNPAWPVTYFADPPLLDHHRFNTWGTNGYEWRGPEGDRRWNECTEDTEVLDFDLRPWIESGRLRWTAPGEPTMELRQTTDGCPYLDLDGVRAFQRVSFGKIWTELDG